MSLLGVVYTEVQSWLWFYGKGWKISSLVSNITLSTHADSMLRRNLPNSLSSPRAQSAALVVRFDLLPSILHCQWISSSPLISLLHHFFYYHSLIQLFSHVFHKRSCVIRKELHVHLCHSWVKTHHSLFGCVSSRYRCNSGLEDKSHVVSDGLKAFFTSKQKQRKNKCKIKSKKGEECCTWLWLTPGKQSNYCQG